MKKLVEYGPKAVPFLLKALDDSSPSKMMFKTADSRQGNDLPWNPVNLSEVAVAKQVKAQPKTERHGSGLSAVNFPDLYFDVTDSYKDMDRQIEQMKQEIADMKKAEK